MESVKLSGIYKAHLRKNVFGVGLQLWNRSEFEQFGPCSYISIIYVLTLNLHQLTEVSMLLIEALLIDMKVFCV